MNRNNQTRRQINSELKRRGFGGLEDPNLMLQMAFCCPGHDKFKAMLAVMPPEKRLLAYNQLRPHLRFEAKPLDVYIAEIKQDAEREKLPIAHPDPQNIMLTDFDDYHNQAPSIEVLAERAILHADREARMKGALKLVCRKCTLEQDFPGKDKAQSINDAKLDGWVFERISKDHDETALCPRCSPRLRVARA